MNLYNRMLAAAGLAALTGLGAVPAQAQAPAYPTRSITMIVPFAAGGPTDVIARIVTGHMQQTLGQTIVIETGAPGAIPGWAGHQSGVPACGRSDQRVWRRRLDLQHDVPRRAAESLVAHHQNGPRSRESEGEQKAPATRRARRLPRSHP